MNKTRPLTRFLPDFSGLFSLITFLVLTFFRGNRSLNDGDTFWHIAAGQRMLDEKVILTSDMFSHTAAGKPWTAHEWLSEIIMAAIHEFAGFPGLCIFFFFITSLSFWLLFKIAAKESNEWYAFLFVALAFILSLNHLLARPHLFTWFLGSITFFVLQKSGKYLYVLPFISVLWANLHGGFILGIALQGMFLAGNYFEYRFSSNFKFSKPWFVQNRPMLIIFLLSIAAAGINPFGFSLYLFPFHVSSEIFAQGINEWISPNLQKQWIFRYFLLFIIFLISQHRVVPTWRDRLFFIFFLNAALTHQRHISIATFYIAPFLAKSTHIWSAPILSKYTVVRKKVHNQLILSKWTGPSATFILFILLIFLSSSLSPNTKIVFENLIQVPNDRFPIKAIEFLSKSPMKGNIFNDYSWGGYSIYALNTKHPVFIDGRADMYGPEIFSEYIKVVKLDKELTDILDKHKIDIIFYHTDSPLIRYLKSSSGWSEVYADELATILKKL